MEIRDNPTPIDRIWVSDVMEGVPWSARPSSPWRKEEHITMLESRSGKAVIKDNQGWSEWPHTPLLRL